MRARVKIEFDDGWNVSVPNGASLGRPYRGRCPGCWILKPNAPRCVEDLVAYKPVRGAPSSWRPVAAKHKSVKVLYRIFGRKQPKAPLTVRSLIAVHRRHKMLSIDGP